MIFLRGTTLGYLSWGACSPSLGGNFIVHNPPCGPNFLFLCIYFLSSIQPERPPQQGLAFKLSQDITTTLTSLQQSCNSEVLLASGCLVINSFALIYHRGEILLDVLLIVTECSPELRSPVFSSTDHFSCSTHSLESDINQICLSYS